MGYLGQQRMIELVKRNYWWPRLKEDIKKIFKNASNINRIKSNIKRNLKNFTHSKYYQNYSKKSALTLLDHYLDQMGWMLSWL